ncbi:hypothetical protein V7T18_14900 [Segatella copri]|uniref:hypothetical protein n=1 Tax=Segatella copri TaxID=165179 RepID=UPI0025EB1DB1|nr:hypothetical protein [uncultured Prevotella sp.]
MKAERTYKKQASRTLVQKKNKKGVCQTLNYQLSNIIDKNGPLQMKTKVMKHEIGEFYDDVKSNTKEVVGTRVDVLLDPHDPQHGSEPGTDLDRTMWAINTTWNTNWIKGHLLNHHIGGPGIASNLYPISKSANSYHYRYVENQVINMLGKLSGNQGIYYSVEVTEANHKVSNPNSKLTCEAYTVDDVDNPQKYEVIFRGIDILSELNAKPQPVLANGVDAWNNSFTIGPKEYLSHKKREYSGWKYEPDGKYSWNSYNW